MTVQELIDALSGMPREVAVVFQGTSVSVELRRVVTLAELRRGQAAETDSDETWSFERCPADAVVILTKK